MLFDNLLVEKYRPSKLADLVLSKKNREYFETVRAKQEIPHVLFSGDAGIGKSTLARIIVEELLNCQYIYINASDESGIDTIRTKVTNFAQTRSLDGKLKVIVLDEIDGLGRVANTGSSAQGALRNVIEKYAETTRFIATCNYSSQLITPVRSRFLEFDLTPPYDQLAERIKFIIRQENIKVPEDQKSRLEKLVKNHYPDMRKMIGEIQRNSPKGILDLEEVEDNIAFAAKLFKKIQEKTDCVKLREFIITNEIEFECDYHRLLRNLFEVVYKSSLKEEKKAPAMLTISNKMLEHQTVMDKEINFFSCVLELMDVLK